MAINDPRAPTRKELAEVFSNNQRLIRAFEKIFDLIPPEFIDQQAQIDAINLIAGIAEAQSTQALSMLERIASSLEVLSQQPIREADSDSDDLLPQPQLGTLSEQQADQVEISGGSVEAALTDNTTNLAASSQTLNDGAAAATGTLTNAPAAGNPTKWVPIDDNGTTRYIPAW